MLASGVQFGGFRIEGVLGSGGMGEVYEARQLSLDRLVALKLMSSAHWRNPAVRSRFRREALAQAALEHPHIVTIYEAGEIEEQPYISMRLIRGQTLKELIRAGALDPERAVRIVKAVADALDTAHKAGLVHRDVKPQNVLVGANDHAYLADFGLTKALEDESLTSLTASGQLVGTLDYVSPEQVQGEEATASSDVYAFAALVFECLTGVVPFRRDSPTALMFAHASEPPPNVTDIRPELPTQLNEILRRALAKEPSERPTSAAQLLEEVKRALDTGAGEGRAEATVPTALPDTPPAPTTKRIPRPSRRRTAWIATGLGAIVALAVAGALVLGGGEPEKRSSATDGGGPADSTAKGRIALGAALSSPGEATPCTGAPGKRESCTIFQTELPGRRVTSPVDGVVVRWNVRDADGSVWLAVVRGTGARAATRATSDPVELSGNGIESFDARVPIGRSDRIALQLDEGARLGLLTGIRGARLARISPPLGPQPVGDAGAFSTSPEDAAVLLAAEVERDTDRDGFGDVSQDRCPGERGKREGCR